MAIRFRPHFAPQYLLGFLLFWIGVGVILSAHIGLNSRSTPTGLGGVAVAVALLVLFVRIWNASEGARWVAGLFAVFKYPSVWVPHAGGISWLDSVHLLALIAIAVGLWRFQQWARWAASLTTFISSIRFVLLLVNAYTQNSNPPQVLSRETLLLTVFALFWGAIALYLLLPSTSALFAMGGLSPRSSHLKQDRDLIPG